MVRIRADLVSIPVGRVDLIPDDYEIVDKRLTNVPVEFPEFKFPLRESQQAVFDEIEDNAIINAWVSWGKTFTGLAIAGKLGQKTLIVTHTVPLRNQWAKEVEKVYGFKPSIIGSGSMDLSGHCGCWQHSNSCTVIFQQYKKSLAQSSWMKCIMSRLRRFLK